jgi:hypothetical protein
MATWGIVATIKASHVDVLNFAAYHLDRGAHRLYIFLDEEAPETYAALKAHPKIRVTQCDDVYWSKLGGKRPVKHQVRQTRNATHTYLKKADTDWLAHIDVDEFIHSNKDITSILNGLSENILCARMRPIEALSGDGNAFKAFIPNGPDRTRLVADIYPSYGQFLKGGFLSHVAGKLFVRTGLSDVQFKIHNIMRNDTMNPGETELSQVELCHCHAKSWEDWSRSYRYRLQKGAYRADLAPAQNKNILNLHAVLTLIEASRGMAGLRAFFDEVSADTPQLRTRLNAHGLLRHIDLELNKTRARHFPE